MASDDGQVVLAFNGKMYNFWKLRGNLKREASHSAATRTRRYCSAYLADGLKMLPRLLCRLVLERNNLFRLDRLHRITSSPSGESLVPPSGSGQARLWPQ